MASGAHIQSNTVSVKGMKIFYRFAGSGFPLILLHGSHRSSYLWIRNMPELSTSLTVYAPDWPGYGNSQSIGWRDPLPDMAQVGYDFLRALGHSRAHWVGESRGGGIAIQIATRFPEVVEKLILIASVGLPPDELPKPPEVGSRTKWEWFVERSFEDPHITTEELREVVTANLDKASIYEQRRLAATPLEYHRKGLLEEMVRISFPTLLFWGRQDPVFPVESAERFRQLISSLIDVVLIDNARHLAHYEHPDLFNRISLGFLLHNQGAVTR